VEQNVVSTERGTKRKEVHTYVHVFTNIYTSELIKVPLRYVASASSPLDVWFSSNFWDKCVTRVVISNYFFMLYYRPPFQ
jgi:hypothetical protein